MKFIISSLSPGMVEYGDFMLSFHEVTDTEFQALCYDGYSCVSHQDIADAINVAHNKETVHARPGDVLQGKTGSVRSGNVNYNDQSVHSQLVHRAGWHFPRVRERSEKSDV